jgi:hypothetical protein
MVSRMKKVEPIAMRARKKAKKFLEQDDRINTLFELYDVITESWEWDTALKSSRTVKFTRLADGELSNREINGTQYELESYEFKLNRLSAQFSKCYPDRERFNSVLLSLSIDQEVVLTATIGIDHHGLSETDNLASDGTFESVEEFYFTPKLIELINFYRKLVKEHTDVEEDKENRRLNKLYEGKFRFDGLDDWEREANK